MALPNNQKRYSRQYFEDNGVNFRGAQFVWGYANPVEIFQRVNSEGAGFLFPSDQNIKDRAARILRVNEVAAAVVALL